MVGQKCYKSEKQKSIIELLQLYHELLLLLKNAILSDQIEAAEEKMDQVESLLPEIQASIKDNTKEFFIVENQSLLLKIKELQQQIYNYSYYKMEKLKKRRPLKLIKYYGS